jgi:hypothetical protein
MLNRFVYTIWVTPYALLFICKRSNTMSYKVSVVIEKDEYGYYAYSPELEGCQSQGDTFEEVMENIREAIELYLETL